MNSDYFPGVFDASMLATYKSCQQLFNLIYLDDWKASEENVHRHAGKAFATALEAARRAFYEEGKDAETAEALGLQALYTAYGDFDCPPDSAKSAERMGGAYEFYLANYPLSEELAAAPPIHLPDGKRGIEFSFAHPLPILHPISGDPLLYCGRSDAIITFAGAPFLEDDKTTKYLGASWSLQWDLRSQFTGYAWGTRLSGIPVAGTIVRGVSILKTKYETQQAVVYSPDWQIERWYQEMCDTVEEVITNWKRRRFRHNLDHSCSDYGGCGFLNVCKSENPQAYLETSFTKKRWNPLTREETLS